MTCSVKQLLCNIQYLLFLLHILSLISKFSETVLTKNVIASYKVESHAECLFHCYENEECVSYNYEYALMDSIEGELRLCEINNMRMSSCPTRKVSKEDHGYYEATDNEKEVLSNFYVCLLHACFTLHKKLNIASPLDKCNQCLIFVVRAGTYISSQGVYIETNIQQTARALLISAP